MDTAATRQRLVDSEGIKALKHRYITPDVQFVSLTQESFHVHGGVSQ